MKVQLLNENVLFNDEYSASSMRDFTEAVREFGRNLNADSDIFVSYPGKDNVGGVDVADAWIWVVSDNLNCMPYPVCQLDYNERTVLNREGPENNENWSNFIDDCVNFFEEKVLESGESLDEGAIGDFINKAIDKAATAKAKMDNVRDSFKDRVEDARVKLQSRDTFKDRVSDAKKKMELTKGGMSEEDANAQIAQDREQRKSSKTSERQAVRDEQKAINAAGGQTRYLFGVGGQKSKLVASPKFDKYTFSMQLDNVDEPRYNGKYVTFDSSEYDLHFKANDKEQQMSFEQVSGLTPKQRVNIYPFNKKTGKIENTHTVETIQNGIDKDGNMVGGNQEQASPKENNQENASTQAKAPTKVKVTKKTNNVSTTESFSIENELNRRDLSGKYYDLYNSYRALPLNENQKREISRMLMEGESNKNIHDYMLKDYRLNE